MSTTPTKLNIMNAALRKVGSYFLDADDTTSTTYQIVNQAYLDAILEIFSENVFSYNTRRIELSAVNANPITNRPYKNYFNLPSIAEGTSVFFNFLVRLEHPTHFYKVTDYEIEGTVLYCNEDSLNVYYTFVPDLEEDAESIPAYLNRLIVLHIAQAISIELSGSENRHEILHVQYEKALRRAKVVEARQGPAQTLISDDTSRILGSHYSYGTIQ
jgi:hypothetical protein